MAKGTAIKLFTVSYALSGKVDDRLDTCLEEQTNILAVFPGEREAGYSPASNRPGSTHQA
jgi:hypothetical protein